MARRWKFWGWGYEGDGLAPDETERLFQTYRARLGIADFASAPPPKVEEIALPAPRLRPPSALDAICTGEPYERLLHSYGKSFPEAVRIFARDFNLVRANLEEAWELAEGATAAGDPLRARLLDRFADLYVAVGTDPEDQAIRERILQRYTG